MFAFLSWLADKLLSRGIELLGGRRSLTERVESSQEAFKRIRKQLREKDPELVERCKAYYRAEHPEWLAPDQRHCFLYGPGWLVTEPLPLDRVRLEYDPAPQVPKSGLRLLHRWWPLAKDGHRLETYHDAIELHDPPAIWFNGASYRLLRFERDGAEQLTLRFGRMSYFDGLDSCAALGFETAATTLGRETGTGKNVSRRMGRSFPGPYRRHIKDPFDLDERACSSNVSAMTIRRSDEGYTFYLQQRSGGEGLQGRFGCLPAGEFQPSGEYSYRQELDIWKCLMREYGEELLGLPERGDGNPIDYEREQPYAALEAARRDGSARIHVLDIGLDALTLKAGIWVVCVFDAPVFDEIFKGMVTKTTEGYVLRALPFTEEQVGDLVLDPRLTQGARQCLSLAWEHREALGLPA